VYDVDPFLDLSVWCTYPSSGATGSYVAPPYSDRILHKGGVNPVDLWEKPLAPGETRPASIIFDDIPTPTDSCRAPLLTLAVYTEPGETHVGPVLETGEAQEDLVLPVNVGKLLRNPKPTSPAVPSLVALCNEVESAAHQVLPDVSLTRSHTEACEYDMSNADHLSVDEDGGYHGTSGAAFLEHMARILLK
jgi:hypothetical protein